MEAVMGRDLAAVRDTYVLLKSRNGGGEGESVD